MGVNSYTQELRCSISRARMFKAMFLDTHNLAPKFMPQAIKSIDIIEGDGREGSIKQINFSEASRFKYVKQRIDELDTENFVCKYTLIQGDALDEKIESITHEIKFEDSGNGGCVCKMNSEYHTKVDAEINDEEIRAGKDKAIVMFRAVEAYLLKNPHFYA